VAEVTSELLVVNLEVFGRATDLTAPGIALKHMQA
jgi:hypothetical protein